jgi:hypothetical protein
VLCPVCAPSQPAARSISTPALKLLRNLQTRGAGMLAVDVPPPVRDEAESMLSLYIHYLLERRPSSAAFLETLRQTETA